MRVSHKYKFAFIAVPKTASTSIREALSSYSDPVNLVDRQATLQHRKASELKEHFEEQGWAWDDYFKFCFVRNPWDRLVSMYFYALSEDVANPKLPEDWRGYCHTAQACQDFEEYVKTLCSKPDWSDFQLSWTVDREGNRLVDFVGRFEDIDHDFEEVCHRVKLPLMKLPRLDPYLEVIEQPKHEHYTEYYTKELREFVREIYSKDIEFFEYEF